MLLDPKIFRNRYSSGTAKGVVCGKKEKHHALESKTGKELDYEKVYTLGLTVLQPDDNEL